MAPSRLVPIFTIFTKLILSAFLIWIIVSHTDFERIIAHINQISIAALLEACLLILVTLFLSSVRQSSILRMFGQKLPIWSSFQISMIGAFFSQALITFLSGDAVRVWCFKKRNIGILEGTSAVFLDRAIGTIGIIVLFYTTLPSLLSLTQDHTMQLGLLMLSLLSGISVILFLILGLVKQAWFTGHRLFGTLLSLISMSRYAIQAPWLFLWTLAISVLVQFINIWTIYILAHGFGVDVSFKACIIAVPVVILISMMPISIAGWGVREGTMSVIFASQGFPAEGILATSVVFGLVTLFVSLPGAIAWLAERRMLPVTN